MHGLDHALGTSRVAHRAAYPLDAGGQGLLAHVLLGPYLCQDLVAGDHPVALLEEIHQDLKDFAPQWDAQAPSAQFIALGIQRTVSKAIVHGRWSSRPLGTALLSSQQTVLC